MLSVKDMIKKERLEAKMPSFSVIGHRLLSPSESMDFLLKNDSFLRGCLMQNYAGNTRGLSDLFSHQCGFNKIKKELCELMYDKKSNLDMAMSRITVSSGLLENMNYRLGKGLYLSSIQSSSINFTSWFNVNTGEIRGWSSSRSKWVSADEIYDDLTHIAKNCFYVDMTVTLLDASNNEDTLKPRLSIRINKGVLSIVDTRDDNVKSFNVRDIFPNSKTMPEMGVDREFYKKFTDATAQRLIESKNKALALFNDTETEVV